MLNRTFPLLLFSNTFSDLKPVCKGSHGLCTQLTSQQQTQPSQEHLQCTVVQQHNTNQRPCVHVWLHTSKLLIYMNFRWFKRFYPTNCSHGLYSCRACTGANPTTTLQLRVLAPGMEKTHPEKAPLDFSPHDSGSDVDHPGFLLDFSDSQLQF